MVVNEQQSFRGTILMYGMILLELPTIALLGVLYSTGRLGENGWIPLVVVGTLIVLTFLLLMNFKLETRMDSFSFSYQNRPFQTKLRNIKKEDISSISIQKKDGFMDYGGVGVRFSRRTRAYVYFADYVIELELGSKKLVFTTKKPKEFEAMIEIWKSENS